MVGRQRVQADGPVEQRYRLACQTFRNLADSELPERVTIVWCALNEVLQQRDSLGMACLRPQQKALGKDGVLAVRLDRRGSELRCATAVVLGLLVMLPPGHVNL